MVRLSVNINKVALIRNSRGANLPDLCQVAKDCEEFGAQGITVHPRPDERHVKFSDLLPLREIVQTEFNIEGYPTDHFISAVLNCKPDQVTLVPDPPGALTSDSGWDTRKHSEFLKKVVSVFKESGIRVSLFLNPDPAMVESAKSTGADRIELYTGEYSLGYTVKRETAIINHIRTAELAHYEGLGINAGHDLNLENLRFYAQNVPGLSEVSIGHALICDALYFGLQNTIGMYLHELRK